MCLAADRLQRVLLTMWARHLHAVPMVRALHSFSDAGTPDMSPGADSSDAVHGKTL